MIMRNQALILLSVLCSALSGAQQRADIGECARARASGPSPASVLPAPPAEPLSAASLARVSEAYERGMAKCLESLESMKTRYEVQNRTAAVVDDTDDDANPFYPELWRCKGSQ